MELANDHNLHPGVLVTSAYHGIAPVEVVRGPRAATMVELIQQYPDLSSTIERMSARAMSVQVDFPTADFPKETAERLEILARCDKYVHALAVKDHMLWVAMNEKTQIENELVEERRLCAAYAGEVTEWAHCAQGLAVELAVLKKDKTAGDLRAQELVNILRQHNIMYLTPDQD